MTLKRYLLEIEVQKLTLFGKRYIVDYCIVLFQKEQKEEALIEYITTGIQFISENIAGIGVNFKTEGRYLSKSFSEVINPLPEDNRTAEEIVDDVLDKCGLLGG